MFLADVFLTGNAVSKSQAEVKDSAKELLLEATKGFTAKYNTTEVGVQEFYMDLLKDFTIYLTENEEKYSEILEIFFEDTPKTETSAPASQANEEIEL